MAARWQWTERSSPIYRHSACERVRHARSIGCGPVDLAADGHVFGQARTLDGGKPFTGNGRIRYLCSLRPGKRDRDFGDLVARGFDGDGLPVTARIDGQTG